MVNKYKKKIVYTEKYRKGFYEHDRLKVKEWVQDPDVTMEIREASKNDDGTESVTIVFNNIKVESEES